MKESDVFTVTSKKIQNAAAAARCWAKRYLKRSDSDLLEEEDDSLDHLGPLLLQAEQGVRRADEDLGLAVGHVVVNSTALQEPLHRVLI